MKKDKRQDMNIYDAIKILLLCRQNKKKGWWPFAEGGELQEMFFGKIWKGVKQAASSVWSGVKKVGVYLSGFGINIYAKIQNYIVMYKLGI